MSENNHEELFKTTLMGGFDKDDVMTKVQNLKDQAYAAQKKLEAKIEEKEQEIEKLNRKIREREDKIEELEKNIHEKYQSYIDNYDSISGLVFEAQVKAKKLTQETEDACREKTEETDAACRKLTEETEESCRKLKEETEEACRRKTEETDESCREKTEETDEACCKKKEETNESCRKQREETKESCAKQRRETKEQCEYMVESARQKGEELAAVYEEKLQAEAEEIQSHMDAELQKANTRYQKIYAEMETMTSVLEKNRRIFEETFAGIEKMREEMKRSASEVETFMKDPVKSIFPGEEKETAIDNFVEANNQKQTAKIYQHNPEDPYSLPNNTVRCIFISKTNAIWIGTDKGLALFNPHKEQFITFQNQQENPNSLLSNQINDIGESRDGKLWVCAHMGGVSILDLNDNVFTSPENMHFQNIRVTNDLHGISSPNAKCFLQDSFGNIWLGNYRGGVDFLSYNQPVFQTLAYNTLKDGTLTDKQVWGIALDNKSRIWLGGENEIAIFSADMKYQKILSLANKANPHTHVSTIFKDKNGILWLGLYKDGILTCDPSTEKITRIELEDKKADICCFYEENNKIWIGTQNGLYSYQNGKIAEEKGINEQLTDIMIHGIQRDRQGKLWLGTFGKGLIVFSPEGKRTMRFEIGRAHV